MKEEFKDLDEAIIDAIRRRIDTYLRICLEVRKKADAMQSKSGSDRLVDRRLQSIRKRGIITFKAGRWQVIA